MKVTEAINNITNAYERYYDINLSFVVVPGRIFNPILKSYRVRELSLKEACILLHSKISVN